MIALALLATSVKAQVRDAFDGILPVTDPKMEMKASPTTRRCQQQMAPGDKSPYRVVGRLMDSVNRSMIVQMP